MPTFFFTLSFLKSFFQKYQDKWLEGIPQENQESFIRFLRCQKGHILIDTTISDIDNYPHLYSIIEPSTTTYRPFESNSQVSIPDFIAKELNDEFHGIISHTAAFTNSLKSKITKKLQKNYLKPLFNQKEVEDKFGRLLNTINPKRDENISWNDILAPFSIPTRSIIISDNYLPTRAESIDYNLIPILNFFTTLNVDKIPVVILSAKKTDINYKSIKLRLEQRLNREFTKYFKIEILFVEGGLKVEHDRRIVSDTMSLSVPHGLDLLKSKKAISRGTTEPSLISFFDGKIENTEHLYFLQSSLKKSIDIGRDQLKNL